MSLRQWLRPPRQVLLVFLAVAVVSATAVGWLAKKLAEQDAVSEGQQQDERLKQAADRAVAVIQGALSDLQTMSGVTPAGVTRVSIATDGTVIRPSRGLLDHPGPEPAPVDPDPSLFAEANRLEAAGDLASAATAIEAIQASSGPAEHAEALTRLARIARARHDPAEALRLYDRLDAIDADIGGLPAGLVARVGRASVFDAAGRASDLRREAGQLVQDLAASRWRLSHPAYESYRNEAMAWLGARPSEDPEAVSRAAAVEWFWAHRTSLEPSSKQLVNSGSVPMLVAWRIGREGCEAAIAGPEFLASLGVNAVAGQGLRWALKNPEDHLIAGDRSVTHPEPRLVAGLPLTLQVSPASDSGSASPALRPFVAWVLGTVAVVLIAGCYFIMRAVSREVGVAQMQADFVSAVSHEFRSPLTSLAHVADLLAADRLPSEAARKRSYDVLVRETDRLRRLVEDLLDLSRFDGGAAAFSLETCEVGELARATVEEFREPAARDGFIVELTVAPRPLPARVNRESVARAFWNLLDNAAKYSPECRTIWVDVRGGPRQVAISVRDRGLGIPPSEQSSVFDRFVRGSESKTRRIRGTGIGLAMVRQIARAHGGDVALTSEVGQGSTFTMFLPLDGVRDTVTEPSAADSTLSHQ